MTVTQQDFMMVWHRIMEEEELYTKPCPLCGGENTYVEDACKECNGDMCDYNVICDNPSCALIGPVRETPESAAEIWNDRSGFNKSQ